MHLRQCCISVILLVVLAGCSTAIRKEDLAPIPDHALVLMGTEDGLPGQFMYGHFNIGRINGTSADTTGLVFPLNRTRYKLVPGENVIEVDYKGKRGPNNISYKASVLITANFGANRVYWPRGEADIESRVLRIWIEDANTGEIVSDISTAEISTLQEVLMF